MIERWLEIEILRLFHAEGWLIETIAREHGVHHDVVRRVIEQEKKPPEPRPRTRMVDPYVPFLRETLAKYPRIAATRLYDMVRERGYPGRPTQFRAIVAELRPPRSAQAYLRLRTLPGEQAQVDWGHFGRLQVGRASRPLVAFVMVLSYSRAIYLRFFLSQSLGNFLAGHEAAFRWFGGIPRCCLYDNLRSVVLERVGNAIRFHDTFLDFAAHGRFEPRPVAIARGNEKGRVERAIRYIRDRFFAARRYRDLDDLNEQAKTWCETTSLERKWIEDSRKTVVEVFREERGRLLPLPDDPFPGDDRLEVSAGKTPYIRFDGNDYSIPHEHVGKTLVVLASEHTVRILDGQLLIATHDRSFDQGLQIEDPIHIERLAEEKREAAQHRTTDLLSRSVPSSADLLGKIAERGLPLGRATKELHELLRTYGSDELERAIVEAIRNDTPHTQAVRHILDRDRRSAGRRPVLPLELPDDARVRDLFVKPHDLRTYDLHDEDEDEDETERPDEADPSNPDEENDSDDDTTQNG